MKKVYILHENSEWTIHLTRELDKLNVPYEEWFLDRGAIDLSAEPPEGVFYNRMSASSHTRGHRYAPELTSAVLSWLERHQRKVFNGVNAIQLEVSKAAQYMALQTAGILTPKTVVASGKEELLHSAGIFEGKPFITKHNRAGKGLGVRLFQSQEGLEKYVSSSEFEDSVDGLTLLQEYIDAPDQRITRCEFLNGKFLYAVSVDSSEGFELCPADACSIGEGFCPAGEESLPKFSILDGFDESLIKKYEGFLQENGIAFAGIENIQAADGRIYTYDVNTNTNYNSEAENIKGIYAMKEMALILKNALLD
ncbi:alpha-L-glutamate ligase [Bacillus lacus]|uniref:Alpha-L-glutamate ligase n=1 Tax=Metabacillus lacus TaxID=1983721 RepID=A0A7X2LXD2_9BACI|nr:alpha-L-glutamate ligase [Metabacillus lacus]MRX71166.1 alpha-L-glutamate ligase [Metabacillus lacus]